MNMIEYKGYLGTIEHDLDERVLFGKVVNVDGQLAYEGETLSELRAGFIDVVDTYIALCEAEGIEPRRPSAASG